ncbi:hypothetical protein P8452_75394 [Trifolium repens]|nr:hypothetical protein P8452_75394 [Trifolium repens]
MASRMLLKIKINLRFLPKPCSILTRSNTPIAKPEAPQIFNKFSVLSGMTHNLFARQMGTSRSPANPRGSHRVSDEIEEDEDFDGDNDDEFDDDDVDTFDIDENDLDDDDQDEVEEVAPKKKSSRK